MDAQQPGYDGTEIFTLEQNTLAERRYESLRKHGFIRAPSAAAQWLVLLNQAWAEARVPPMPEVKAYLWTMLSKNVQYAEIASVSVGLEFYQAAVLEQRLLPEMRRHLADTTLLYAGLFHERQHARRSMLSQHHLVRIGQTLYHGLFRETGDVLFGTLANAYLRAILVLRCMRPAFALKNNVGIPFPRNADAAKSVKHALRFEHMFFSAPFRA